MDAQTTIVLVLIVSILGIIAVSVYSLYLQDKLITRVETLERNLENSAGAGEMNSGKNSKSQNGTLARETELIPGLEVRIQTLANDLATDRLRLQTIEKELGAKIGILANLQSTQQTNDASISSEIQLLRKQVAELKRQLDYVQKENAEIITRMTLSEEL